MDDAGRATVVADDGTRLRDFPWGRDGRECRKACLEAGGVVHTLSRAESQRFERGMPAP